MSAPHAPSKNPASQGMLMADSPGNHDQRQQYTNTQTAMGPLSFASRSDASKDSDGNSRSTARSILVFSAVVAPLALVPYLFVRRRLVSMDKQLASVQALLAKEFKASRAQADAHHQKAVGRADAALDQTRKQLAELRGGIKSEFVQARKHVADEVGREASKLNYALVAAIRVADRREGRRRTWEADVGRKVDALANEELARRTQLAADLRELGRSLADTAAFIEEVEMRQGWVPQPRDGRGIERMRRLAKRLHEFASATVRVSPHTAWLPYVLLIGLRSKRHRRRRGQRRNLCQCVIVQLLRKSKIELVRASHDSGGNAPRRLDGVHDGVVSAAFM
ncbi:hypothetical protein C8Q70DRAFT_755939 [Cubamyces menziesii]|nr:hypothetical protein C8Q70DRAFT_755939 [Cubamyces menziesii]